MPILKVIDHKIIANETYSLTLQGADYHKPGQFIEVLLPGGNYFLRRPFSIADQIDDEIVIIYKTFGEGTRELTTVEVGEKLDCLTNLGNGFIENSQNKTIVLIGGGLGVPPLYYLGKTLKKQGYNIKTVLGFNSKSDCFLVEEFKALGEVFVTTLDGSYGTKGMVLDVLKEMDVWYYYAVGPINMLKAIVKKYPHGQVSLEERMGCGFGACMGCSIKTKDGFKRVCKEGPVFETEVLLWED